MKFLANVFKAAVLTISISLLANGQADTRISKTWKVEKYDLTATLPTSDADRNLGVKAILNLKNTSGATATTLTLRINQNADISSVKINDTTAEFSKNEEKIGGGGSLQRIVIRLPAIKANESFIAAVDYNLNIKENLGTSSMSAVAAHFLPLSFWYPTPNSWFFSRGADFAPFRVSVSAPDGLTVLSSGKAAGTAFEQELNDQPFLVAGNWDSLSFNNISVYAPKGAGAEEKSRAAEIAALTAEARSFTETLLGPAPDVPIRIVAVRRGAGFSGGGTIFVDDAVFNREKIDAQTVLTVAESMAKIWLGNAVLVDKDGYGVIREGLARYIAAQFIEKKYGKDIADVERLRQRMAYAAVSKRDAPLRFASPLDDYYYASVANKGAMIWRLLDRNLGTENLFQIVRNQIKDGETNLDEIREALSSQKVLLDYEIDEVLDMNLMVGLPVSAGGVTTSNLRNTGGIDALVEVVATTSAGQKITKDVTIPAKGFGEVSFETTARIVETEVDADKLYPQTEYADDAVPGSFDESAALLTIKRAFDKQDYISAEKSARQALEKMPRFDDASAWVGRALLAQGKITDAERVFRTVLDEKLPTARSLAWANAGLGEISLKTRQTAQALEFFNKAIRADAEYGATLAARQGRRQIGTVPAVDESIRSFFAGIDKAAVSGRKADLDALIVPGEMIRFAGGVAGAQQWQSRVTNVDKIDSNTVLVEANLTIKLLTKEEETGMAVFRIVKAGSSWKLSGVEMFEVR